MKRILSVITILTLVAMSLATTSVRANEAGSGIVHAQGSSYHVDFVSLLSKRSDLRLNVASKGLDAAFTQWLKSQHPDSYREALASKSTEGNFEAAAKYCCAKDGNCCKTNCSQCCAKGACTMGCCKMKVCNAMKLACCK